MDLEKYKNDGWGLSRVALDKLIECVESFDSSSIKVAEFGSGTSTRFFVDLSKESKKEILITSFDNDLKYSYQKIEGDLVDLRITDLVECSDSAYEKMFENKVININDMKVKTSPLHTRQKNNFYDIKNGDLSGNYDIMVLDGPHGNGRNISFLHMKDHLKSGSYVLIDDYTHYDFVERFLSIFEAEEFFKNNTGMDSQWENGGDFVIYKVK